MHWTSSQLSHWRMYNSTHLRCLNLHQVRNEGGFCIQQHKKWRRIDTLEVQMRWRKFLIFASKFHIYLFIKMNGILLAHALGDCWYYRSSIHFSLLLDENEFITREDFFHDPAKLAKDFDLLDRYTLGQNSFLGWIKSMIFRDKSHWSI